MLIEVIGILVVFVGLLLGVFVWFFWPKRGASVARSQTRARAERPDTATLTREAPKAQEETTIGAWTWEEFLAWMREQPHIGVLGETKSGKTTLAKAILNNVDGLAVVLDPNDEPNKWPIPAITTDDDDNYGPLDSAVRSVFQELKRRVKRKREGLPVGEPITMIWDEVNDHMEESDDAGDILRRLVKRARTYSIRVVIFPHSKNVKALGIEGHGDTTKNIGWVYLGDQARARAKMVFQERRVILVEHNGRLFHVKPSDVLKASGQPSRVVPMELEEPEAPVSRETQSVGHLLAAYHLGLAEGKGSPITSARKLDEVVNGKSGGRSSVEMGKVISALKGVLNDQVLANN